MKSYFTVSVAWLALASSPVAAQVTGSSTGQSSGGGAAVDPIPPRPSSSDGTASAESAQLGDNVVDARGATGSLRRSPVATTASKAAAFGDGRSAVEEKRVCAQVIPVSTPHIQTK